MQPFGQLELAPAYALTDAAFILRLPRSKVVRWADALQGEQDNREPLEMRAVSYVNLLELHVLRAMRIKHAVPLQRIRKALEYLRTRLPTPHPLLDRRFSTDGLDLFFEHNGDIVNASRGGQGAIRELVGVYLARIDWHAKGSVFYPFVRTEQQAEPRLIQMQPSVAFGRPVIAGTGIAADVIAGRFFARESAHDLAEEYGISVAAVEEAVRWELPRLDAA